MTRTGSFVLLFSVFLIAACALVYELVVGAVSSYLLGSTITQFSLVIGIFLSAMGLGSFLSKYSPEKAILLNNTIWSETAIAGHKVEAIPTAIFLLGLHPYHHC